MNNTSPLRYPGGKSRACKILDKVLNEHFDINKFDVIISPFIGGGSFEFHLQNTYDKKLIVNDKFAPLINFWNQCKTNKTQLCLELKKHINCVSKEQFTTYRSKIMDTKEELKQATYYFIINRSSFSGATLSGGFSEEASKKRFTLSSIERIENLDLSNIDFHNLDFKPFIKKFHKKKLNSLLFLDPPYYLEKKSNLYGDNGNMHDTFDHQELFNSLSKKSNWLMTYNNCDYIRNLYKDYIIIDANWSYGMNASKKSSEIIIISK